MCIYFILKQCTLAHTKGYSEVKLVYLEYLSICLIFSKVKCLIFIFLGEVWY